MSSVGYGKMNKIYRLNQNADSDTSIGVTPEIESNIEVDSNSKASPKRTGTFGLTTKLFVVTLILAVICELTVLIPSIANFEKNWIQNKFSEVEFDIKYLMSSKNIPLGLKEDIRKHLTESVKVESVAVRDGQTSTQIDVHGLPDGIDKEYDLSNGSMLKLLTQSIDTLLFGDNRVLEITGISQLNESSLLEVTLMESHLRGDLINFTLRTLGFSIPILIVISAVVFFLLQYMFVRPVQRLSDSIGRFAANPEDLDKVITPSNRTDEIGLAEQSLVEMEHRLVSTIREHRHLANLGLAVSKINHDLRNMLASAQLLLERLEDLPDPTVQRLAPKIILTLDRAVAYTRAVIDYGKTTEAPPRREVVLLSPLVDEVGELLSLDSNEKVKWENQVSNEIEVDADPEHLFRILMNLCQNSLQAMESKKTPVILKQITVSAERLGSVVQIQVTDTGPGVPYMARDKIFHAFQSSFKTDGFGLGLSIAAELVEAHGGKIMLKESDTGAIFEISIPDNPIDFSSKCPRIQNQAHTEQRVQSN